MIEQPAVIITAQTAILDDTIGKICTAMATLPIDQPDFALPIAVENQVFAENSHWLQRIVFEFSDRGDRVPVAAQQVTHRRARPNLGKALVLGLAHHEWYPRAIFINCTMTG